MKNITIFDADEIRRAALKEFGVDLQIHDPCGAHGFYLTMNEAHPDVARFVIEEFEKMGATAFLADDGCTIAFHR